MHLVKSDYELPPEGGTTNGFKLDETGNGGYDLNNDESTPA